MADEPKPAYVQFEYRTDEDREASIEAGHYVGKDVIYAIVTPAGTRDRLEKVAEDWIKSVEEGVNQERIPSFWLTAYKQKLEDFKNSRETPEDGFPVMDWPVVSPKQVKMLLDINVRTVEDLAAANEETVTRIGMGGRALKQKAIDWLANASGPGKISAELDKLRVQNEELLTRDKEREAEFEKMKRQLEALTPKEKEKV